MSPSLGYTHQSGTYGNTPQSCFVSPPPPNYSDHEFSPLFPSAGHHTSQPIRIITPTHSRAASRSPARTLMTGLHPLPSVEHTPPNWFTRQSHSLPAADGDDIPLAQTLAALRRRESTATQGGVESFAMSASVNSAPETILNESILSLNLHTDTVETRQSSSFVQTPIITNISTDWREYQQVSWGGRLVEKIKDVKDSSSSERPPVVAISGIPGSGKKSLAQRYASQFEKICRDNKFRATILIIEADESGDIWSSYKIIVEELLKINTSPRQNEGDKSWKKRICGYVNQRLKELGRWLLIFDNVQPSFDIRTYVPSDNDGIVLLTTTDDNLLDKLLKHNDSHLRISEGLDPEDSVKLMQTITGLPIDDDAYALAEALDRLPLYLSISAKAIAHSQKDGPQNAWTYKTYKAHIENLPASQLASEQQIHAKCTVKEKTQHAVIQDQIYKLSEYAKELLVYCCYLCPREINVTLLDSYIKNKFPQDNDDMIKSKRVGLLNEIQQCSLLQQIPGTAKYNIQRVTQQIGRELAPLSREQINYILNATLLTIVNNDSVGLDYNTCKLILPHMENFITCSHFVAHLDKKDYARLLYNIGRSHSILGDLYAAEKHFNKLIDENFYCETSPAYTTVRHRLAKVYSRLGRAQESKNLLVEVLNILKQQPERASKEIAGALDDIAVEDINLGNPQEAETSLTKVLELIKKDCGDASIEYADALNTLGLASIYTGKLDAAKEHLEHSLKIVINQLVTQRKKKLHVLLPTDNTTLLNLVCTIIDGDDHGDYRKLALILNNLGHYHVEAGHPQHAKELLEVALQIRQKLYGEYSWQVSLVLDHLGYAHLHLGNITKAKSILELALKIRQKHYGDAHWRVASILNVLGDVYINLGDAKSAVNQLQQALSINKQFFGDNHYQVATTLTNLGGAFIHAGNYKDALTVLTQAKKINKHLYTAEHFKVAIVSNNLALAYINLRQFERASDELNDALEIIRTSYGDDHWRTAWVLDNLALTHIGLGIPASGEKLLSNQVLPIMHKSYYHNPNNWRIGRTLHNLGYAYLVQKNYELAEKNLLEAREIMENHYNPAHLQVAMIKQKLATIYLEYPVKQNVRAAKELLEQAHTIFRDHYGDNLQCYRECHDKLEELRKLDD